MHTRHENSIYRVSVRAIHGVMSPPDFGGFSVSGQPSAGREFGDPIDREVSQSRQDRAKIVADWNLESLAGFDDLRLWLQPAVQVLASDADQMAERDPDAGSKRKTIIARVLVTKASSKSVILTEQASRMRHEYGNEVYQHRKRPFLLLAM